MARAPARQGAIPAQPRLGGRPVVPEVSLVSSPISPVPVPSTNSTVEAGRAHRLPALTAQVAVDQDRMPSAPTAASRWVVAWSAYGAAVAMTVSPSPVYSAPIAPRMWAVLAIGVLPLCVMSR